MDWNKVVGCVAMEEGLLVTEESGTGGSVGAEPVLVPYGQLGTFPMNAKGYGVTEVTVRRKDGSVISVEHVPIGSQQAMKVWTKVRDYLLFVYNSHKNLNDGVYSVCGKYSAFVGAITSSNYGPFIGPEAKMESVVGSVCVINGEWRPDEDVAGPGPTDWSKIPTYYTNVTQEKLPSHLGPTSTGVMPGQCPNGYHWDYQQKRCVQTAPFRAGNAPVMFTHGEPEPEQQLSRHAVLFYQLGLGEPPGELGAERPQVTYGHPRTIGTCPVGQFWDAAQGKCVTLPGMRTDSGPGPTRDWKIYRWNVSGAAMPTTDVYMDQVQVQQHIRNVYNQINFNFDVGLKPGESFKKLPTSMYQTKVQALPAPNTPIPTGGAYGFETTDGQHVRVLQAPMPPVAHIPTAHVGPVGPQSAQAHQPQIVPIPSTSVLVKRTIRINGALLWESTGLANGGTAGETQAIKSLWKSAYDTMNQPASSQKGAKIEVCSSWTVNKASMSLCTSDGVNVVSSGVAVP